MFTDPMKNLKTLELKENDIVADLGAGTGFYSLAAGKLVPRGKVYAVEIVRDFLETVRKKVQDQGLDNVEVLWGDVEKPGGTKLGDGIADAVIASNILFLVEDKEQFVREAQRILKPKGKVLLVDWSESSVLGVKNVFPKDKAREMFERGGFVFDRDINAGAHHYGMILVKS